MNANTIKKVNICLCLTAPTISENLDKARNYVGQAKLVELRFDLLHHSQLTAVRQFPKECNLPVIFTIRRYKDGGGWTYSEKERWKFLQIAAESSYEYIDIEADLPENIINISDSGPKIIRSYHDYKGTPHSLSFLLVSLPKKSNEIAKLAVATKSITDVEKIFDAIKRFKQKKIIIGMGEYGICTRVLPSVFDSFLTFCSSGKKIAAPGHVDIVNMIDQYRVDHYMLNQPIYGIIGNPLSHSISPLIHNRGLKGAGLSGMYIPFKVDKLASFLTLASKLRVAGLSVTVPYKESIISMLNFSDEIVSTVKSCNTLINRNGYWHGYNTDVEGFLWPLREKKLLHRIKKATVIGSGGAARAVVWGLREIGIEVLIVNRTIERAKSLSLEMDCRFTGLDSECLEEKIRNFDDLIVQSTVAGLSSSSNEELDPIRKIPLKGHEIIYDIVASPLITPLIKRAKNQGCIVIYGIEMLLAQAYVQFRLMTSRDFPVKIKMELNQWVKNSLL